MMFHEHIPDSLLQRLLAAMLNGRRERGGFRAFRLHFALAGIECEQFRVLIEIERELRE